MISIKLLGKKNEKTFEAKYCLKLGQWFETFAARSFVV